MFASLSERLQAAFATVRRETRLTPESVEPALREIRLALLEADVNFKVVKAFIDRVRDRAVDRDVLESLTPAEQVVAIVRDELRALLGDGPVGLTESRQRPQVVLLLGLQGAGKTTTTVKLARWLTTQGRHPLVVSTDVRRPAAIEQLSVLAGEAGIRVHDPSGETSITARAEGAIEMAGSMGFDVVLVDTAGRLHIDVDLMGELEALKTAVGPTDLLYVADAMTGQDAIKSAGEFNRRLGISGVVLTKMDGDARGGAALSVVSVVGVPVAFVGDGERLDDLQPFHADRLVSRMLGMGDVLSLVERAEQVVSREDATRLEQKIRRNEFTLQDMRDQLTSVKRMGPLDRLVDLIPGMGQMAAQMPSEVDPKALVQTMAIIDSMTIRERLRYQVIDGSRRRRIARGSGTTVQDVNRLLKQFVEMRRMLKTVGAASRSRKNKGGRRRARRPRAGLPGA
ncbi:MAG: signal recognition particle protein [Vicinamibacterales bacterium]|jgi:signal recognition particle subunit SRP54|nr:signal recognition particle protein [Vicinamibacterales bacterium]